MAEKTRAVEVTKAMALGWLAKMIEDLDRLGRDWWAENPATREAVFITMGVGTLGPDSVEVEVPDGE